MLYTTSYKNTSSIVLYASACLAVNIKGRKMSGAIWKEESIKIMQCLEKQQQISPFFCPSNHPLHEKVIRAEVKVSTVLAYHNIPIAISDHMKPLFKDIFPDSQIAKAYSCAHTKTTCILNGALAKHFQSSLVEYMKA